MPFVNGMHGDKSTFHHIQQKPGRTDCNKRCAFFPG
jgi:hypothetical protein